MDYYQALHKYGADKLALLGMFVLGLLVAYLISATRYGWPRSAAIELTDRIKGLGISSIQEKEEMEKFFLVKDSAGRVAGFTIEIFSEDKQSERFDVEYASHYYIKGRYSEQQKAFFQSGDHLEEFIWRSETVTPGGTKAVVIKLSKNGMLTVTRADGRASSSFKIGRATLPSTVLDLVFGQMLETGVDEIILDIIRAQGSIVQMLISREDIEDADSSRPGREYKFRVDIAHRQEITRYVYLDSDKKISGIILQGRRKYELERSRVSEIREYFPDKVDYLSDREDEPETEDKLLQQVR